MGRCKLKRFFDLSIIFIFSPILVFLFIVLSLLVRIKIGRNIIFYQPRPGLNGKVFNLLKFRTMTNERDANGDLLTDDLRLTKFGILLRSTSLDELPSLINVLKGEMSLVGPRPLLVEYLPLYTPEQNRRHNVTPGITGWAQVNGRNSISWEQKFEYDIWYVNNHSILLDIKILLLTLKKVFVRDGISSDCSVTMPPFRGTNNDNQ